MRAEFRTLRRGACAGQSGFTILELLLAVAVMALLGAISVPLYTTFVDRARVGAAITDIGELDMRIERHVSNNFTLPDNLNELAEGAGLDPWGQPYQYTRIRGNAAPGLRGRLRKDRNLVPINSDYDLYSFGADGDSRPPLAARPSHDDVVRAADGSFVGSAAEF